MIDFIDGHFKYYLMNSWNLNRGYAIDVKIYNMGFNKKVTGFVYEAFDVNEFYSIMNDEINCFTEYLKNYWDDNDKLEIGSNGRSGGYLVLYYNKTNDMQDQTYNRDELEEMCYADVKKIYVFLKEFDNLKKIIKKKVEELSKNYKVEEQEIQYTKMEKVLVEA